MGVEYYGIYDENGKHPSPLTKFLKKHDICSIHNVWNTTKNGIAERRNPTLMGIVRSMLSNSSIPLSLWMYDLRIVVYLLNRVPSKAIPKTLFELWTSRKPSLRHLHVWGCPAKIRVYNPQEKKLYSRIISGFFIGYTKKIKRV